MENCLLVKCRILFILFFYVFKFFLACGILVPWPGIKPTPPVLEAWNLNHWTTRKVLRILLRKYKKQKQWGGIGFDDALKASLEWCWGAIGGFWVKRWDPPGLSSQKMLYHLCCVYHLSLPVYSLPLPNSCFCVHYSVCLNALLSNICQNSTQAPGTSFFPTVVLLYYIARTMIWYVILILLKLIGTLLSGLPQWLSGERICLQCRRHRKCGLNPCVRKIPWKRAWQPTPVFLLGESHGQRSLVGCSPWGLKELYMTEQLSTLKLSLPPD